MKKSKWVSSEVRMTLKEWTELSESWEKETMRIKNLGIDLSKIPIVSQETYRGKDNRYGTI